jgi:hypothetical protein
MTQTSRPRQTATAFEGHRPQGLDGRTVAAYQPTKNDPFTHECCGGLKPAHTSRCRCA